MVERKWGRVVTIGSVEQVRPHPQLVVYAALKSALVNMVRNLALQLSRTEVTVNNIAPRAILTDRNAGVLADPKYHEWAVGRIPHGVRRIARRLLGSGVLLCSEAGRYMTGVGPTSGWRDASRLEVKRAGGPDCWRGDAFATVLIRLRTTDNVESNTMSERLTLTSEHLRVAVSSKGAELHSVLDKDHREWLWQGDPGSWSRRAPVLFPVNWTVRRDHRAPP